eukprot:TRINITY_DN4010_c0_g1_i12.p2 TRINITY_DN4010_c0_g1~~TRINITY_DN4010_c0_g1_i12.p2  ORF type:complete len:111 (-),score=21.80 TRINITY_DN4010_c0_g1_i12:1245-1577(-)
MDRKQALHINASQRLHRHCAAIPHMHRVLLRTGGGSCWSSGCTRGSPRGTTTTSSCTSSSSSEEEEEEEEEDDNLLLPLPLKELRLPRFSSRSESAALFGLLCASSLDSI